MKYYVITAGEYSGYHIIGVTSDKSKAEKCVKNYKRINCYAEWGGEEIQIEEFDDVHGNFYCSEFADSNSMYRVTKTIKRYIDGKTNTFYDCGNMMFLGQNKPRDFAGYDFETEWYYSNQLFLFENDDIGHVWQHDWDEGQQDVEILAFMRIDDIVILQAN